MKIPLACICSAPGFCEQFQMAQSQRTYEICSGKCPKSRPCTKLVTASYQRKWLRKKVPLVVVPKQSKKTSASVETQLAKPKRAFRQRHPCAHLQAPTGETLPCKVCGKKEPQQIPVYGCGLHTVCSLNALVNREGERIMECCKTCTDYRTKEVE